MWLTLAAMFLASILVWPVAPEELPVHWNAAGEVDAYGGRFQGLLLLPLLATAVYLLMRFLPRLDPGRANYAQFAGAFAVVRLAVLLCLAIVHLVVVLWAVGIALEVARVVPMAVGAMLIVVGSVLGKLRPNWFVGIRTPWTLSSKRAWVKTHRLGGYVFVLLGVLLIVWGVSRPAFSGEVLLGAVAAIAGVAVALLTIYSYAVWRGDPNKLPAVGTTPGNERVA
jgi:uncharacterized membrane protein